MNVTVTDKTITIEIERIRRTSSSGKTVLIASDTAKGAATIDGKALTVAVNAYIPS